MMIYTTVPIALIIVVVLYYFFIRHIPWVTLSYTIIIAVGILCFLSGNVHFMYIGIEIIGLGCLVVWYNHDPD